mgnify:CR=1 FL=1
MAAEKYTSNISTTINKEVHSLLCLVVYELENMKTCKLTNEKEKNSQILLLTPEELNIDTIWKKLNINEDYLISKVITSIQVIEKDVTITNVGTADDYENYNVHVDNNVETTVTNNVDVSVTNKPQVSLDEPIDVRVTNLP